MIRYLAVLGALFCLSAAAPAPRGEGLSLSPGQAVVLTLDANGEVRIVGLENRVALSAFDVAAVQELLTSHPDAYGANSAPLGEGLPTPPPVAEGRIRIALAEQEDGKARLLRIENGYGHGFRYRATIHRGGRSQPTDVCTVLPKLRGYEHWPFKFDRIELTDLRLVPMREGEAPTCE